MELIADDLCFFSSVNNNLFIYERDKYIVSTPTPLIWEGVSGSKKPKYWWILKYFYVDCEVSHNGAMKEFV